MAQKLDEDRVGRYVKSAALVLSVAVLVYGEVADDAEARATGGVALGGLLIYLWLESVIEWFQDGGVYRIVRRAGERWRRLHREWRGR